MVNRTKTSSSFKDDVITELEKELHKEINRVEDARTALDILSKGYAPTQNEDFILGYLLEDYLQKVYKNFNHHQLVLYEKTRVESWLSIKDLCPVNTCTDMRELDTESKTF